MSGTDRFHRYVTDTCEGTWLQDQLDLLAADGWPITQDNMIQFLTTADLDRLFLRGQ